MLLALLGVPATTMTIAFNVFINVVVGRKRLGDPTC
jgi:hypothetical protein